MSRTFIKLLLALLVPLATCAAQTVINPTTQVNWPLVTITGTDTPIQACAAGNYGQPFQRVDVTPNKTGSCGSDGWQYRGSGGGAGITIGSTHVADGGTITNAPGFNSATATAFAATPTPCQNGQYQYGSDASGDALCTSLPTQPGQQYIGPQVLAGCGVQYVSGLTYTVGACTYTINGQTYNSPLSNVTLSAADPTNPEIDVIFVDASQTVQFIQGTPAATPQEPTLNSSTQLGLTFVLVPAASTVPANTTVTNIYLDGSEWPYTVGTNVNALSTNNPYQGVHDVEFGFGGPATSNASWIDFTVPGSSTVTIGNFNNLIFYVRNKVAWPSSCALSAVWLNSVGNFDGAPVVVSNGQFGFDTNTVSAYQQVSIPTTLFQASTPASSLYFYVGGTGCTFSGFYLDYITLQGGVGGGFLPTTLMNYKGVYSSAVAYNQNDVVTSGAGISYIALGANTNVALTVTSTWQVLGGGNTLSASLTTNVLPKATAPHTLGDSLFSDDGTNGAYTGTGGFTAASVKTNGATINGFFSMTSQGSLPPAPGTGTIQITTPNSVTTPYALEMPPNPPPDGTHIYFSCTFANPSVCGWGTGGSSGTVTTTGSPATGNLTKFSGPNSITNGDLSGDVTTSGALGTTIANNAVTTAKINAAAVTYAKMQNISANSILLGSGASGAGAAPVEITLGTNLSMAGTTLNAAGTGATFAFPGIVFGTSTTASRVAVGDIDYQSAVSTPGVSAVNSLQQIANTVVDDNLSFFTSGTQQPFWSAGPVYSSLGIFAEDYTYTLLMNPAKFNGPLFGSAAIRGIISKFITNADTNGQIPRVVAPAGGIVTANLYSSADANKVYWSGVAQYMIPLMAWEDWKKTGQTTEYTAIVTAIKKNWAFTPTNGTTGCPSNTVGANEWVPQSQFLEQVRFSGDVASACVLRDAAAIAMDQMATAAGDATNVTYFSGVVTLTTASIQSEFIDATTHMLIGSTGQDNQIDVLTSGMAVWFSYLLGQNILTVAQQQAMGLFVNTNYATFTHNGYFANTITTGAAVRTWATQGVIPSGGGGSGYTSDGCAAGTYQNGYWSLDTGMMAYTMGWTLGSTSTTIPALLASFRDAADPAVEYYNQAFGNTSPGCTVYPTSATTPNMESPQGAAWEAANIVGAAPVAAGQGGTDQYGVVITNPPISGNYVNLCSAVTLSAGATCSGGIISITTGTTSFTVSAIPGTYINLEIAMNEYSTSGPANLEVQFNSDTASHYTYQQTHGTGTTVSAFGSTALQGNAPVGSVGVTGFGSATKIAIPFYAQTVAKTVSGTGGQAANTTSTGVDSDVFFATWNQTSAITSITFLLSGGNFGTGFMTIYGTN